MENHLISTAWEILDDLPDREIFYIDIFPSWMMFFDGSTHYDAKGAGVVFVSPQRHILPYSLMEKFEQIFLVHIPRKENQMENALTNLTASLTLLKDKTVHVPFCHRWVLLPLPILQEENVNVISIFTIDSEDWQ